MKIIFHIKLTSLYHPNPHPCKHMVLSVHTVMHCYGLNFLEAHKCTAFVPEHQVLFIYSFLPKNVTLVGTNCALNEIKCKSL